MRPAGLTTFRQRQEMDARIGSTKLSDTRGGVSKQWNIPSEGRLFACTYLVWLGPVVFDMVAMDRPVCDMFRSLSWTEQKRK